MLQLWLLSSILWAVLGGSLARNLVQQDTPPLESAPCPFHDDTIPAEQRIDCGYLVVPEDRAAPDGKTIRLAVAIIRARTSHPAPDPIVFLSGGPGDGALDGAGFWASNATRLLAQRDIILVDQRGT